MKTTQFCISIGLFHGHFVETALNATVDFQSILTLPLTFYDTNLSIWWSPFLLRDWIHHFYSFTLRLWRGLELTTSDNWCHFPCWKSFKHPLTALINHHVPILSWSSGRMLVLFQVVSFGGEGSNFSRLTVLEMRIIVCKQYFAFWYLKLLYAMSMKITQSFQVCYNSLKFF
jgi:hypothetical protein